VALCTPVKRRAATNHVGATAARLDPDFIIAPMKGLADSAES
jgi:hypothetical protein